MSYFKTKTEKQMLQDEIMRLAGAQMWAEDYINRLRVLIQEKNAELDKLAEEELKHQ